MLRYAVEHYGVTGVGITLSKEQRAWALRKNKKEGLSDTIEIRLEDYRETRAIRQVRLDRHVRACGQGLLRHIHAESRGAAQAKWPRAPPHNRRAVAYSRDRQPLVHALHLPGLTLAAAPRDHGAHRCLRDDGRPRRESEDALCRHAAALEGKLRSEQDEDRAARPAVQRDVPPNVELLPSVVRSRVPQ